MSAQSPSTLPASARRLLESLAPVLVGLCLSALGLAAPSAVLAWELTRDEDGIKAYKRTQADSPLLAWKAEGVVDAPVLQVMTVLLDGNRAGEWIPRLVQSEVRDGSRWPREYKQFSRFDAPWPVSDRVFYSRVTIDVDPETGHTEIRYFDIDEEIETQGAVQGNAGGSFYVLEPIDDGERTYVSGVSVANPNGFIPTWLVNWVGSSVAWDTLSRLRAQVARGEREVRPLLVQMYRGGEGSVAESAPAMPATASPPRRSPVEIVPVSTSHNGP